MAIPSLGLGKGLDALIRETSSSSSSDLVDQHIALLTDITPNPDQPRRYFSEKNLEELASSIKSQGLLQPILVKPADRGSSAKYEIIAGERRWRASKLAGLKEIPIIVKNLSLEATLIAALVENLQREDLNPIEEALGIQSLKKEFDLSQEDLSQRLGKSRSAIANSLRLLALPPEAQNDVIMGKLSAGHARALLGVENSNAQSELREKIINEKLAVREVEALVSYWKDHGSFSPVIEKGSFAEQSIDSSSFASISESEDGSESTGQKNEEVELKNVSERKISKSRKLLDIQSQLTTALQTPVKVSGSEDIGKISISFSSKVELDSLIDKILQRDIKSGGLI